MCCIALAWASRPARAFPASAPVQLPDLAHWSDIEKVTLAFGYGLTATPIQLARAYAILANGGIRRPLTLLRQNPNSLPAGQQVIDPEVARDVLEVLDRVTEPGGTATLAQVPGFSVGGKTGTVHKVGAGGYLDDQYVALFVGVAPMSAPRYVTAILIDQPRGDHYGGGLRQHRSTRVLPRRCCAFAMPSPTSQSWGRYSPLLGVGSEYESAHAHQ